MANKTYSFNKFSVNFAVPFFVLFIPTQILAWVLFNQEEWALMGIPFGVSLLLGFVLYFGLMARKATMTSDKVIFQGIKTNYEIPYSEIKSLGVFVQGRNGGILLHPREIDKYTIWGVKFIYVSTLESPVVKNKSRDGFICFQYRKEAYQEIINKLNGVESN